MFFLFVWQVSIESDFFQLHITCNYEHNVSVFSVCHISFCIEYDSFYPATYSSMLTKTWHLHRLQN